MKKRIKKMSDNNSTMYIIPKVNSRIMEYAQAASGEISGFGSTNPHTGIIDKLFPLMPQECTGSETEIDAKFITGFIESGQSSTANLWWHSHVNMGVFWSGTDEECINALGRTINILTSIVVNKNREYKARVDVFRPVRAKIEVSLALYYEYPYSEIEKIRAEVKEMVKVKKYATVVVANPHEKFIERKRRIFADNLHGMTEKELNEYGYRLLGPNKIVKMTGEEKLAYWQHQFKEKQNGSEQSELGVPSLFDNSDEFPPTEYGGG
jgi:hypothetical protein